MMVVRMVDVKVASTDVSWVETKAPTKAVRMVEYSAVS